MGWLRWLWTHLLWEPAPRHRPQPRSSSPFSREIEAILTGDDFDRWARELDGS